MRPTLADHGSRTRSRLRPEVGDEVTRRSRTAGTGESATRFTDKAKHKAEEVVGDVREKVGELTGNEEPQPEGKKDQVGGNVKQIGDAVRDAASNVADKFRR